MDSFRPVLEVCKFSEALDILQSVCSVCECWSHAAACEELWSLLSDLAGIRERGYGSHKETYKSVMLKFRIVVLVQNELSFYNCKMKRWSHRTLTRRVFSAKDASIALCGRDVVCCGGFRERSTYRISCKGEVLPIGDLFCPRYRLGLIFHQSQLYAFGGINQCGLRSCEVLSLENNLWSNLPDMKSVRHSFNPFAVGEIIYLWGGRTVQNENFDPLAQVFTLVKPFSFSSDQCAAVKDDTILLLFSENLLQVDSCTLQVAENQQHSPLNLVYSQATPVLWNGGIFTLWQGCVKRVDITSFRVETFRPVHSK